MKTTPRTDFLWVDDFHSPPSGEWTWVKTAQDAIDHLGNHAVSLVSLDYSLGIFTTTRPVVEWMKNNYFPEQINVHSGHLEGRVWLINEITQHAPDALGDLTQASLY